MNLERTLWACLLAALVPTAALGADYTINAGSTDVTVYVTLYHGGDSSLDANAITGVGYNDAGLKVYYIRPDIGLTQIPTTTQSVTGTHADGGWVELSSTNAPGRYRLDLPNAVCQSGASHARVSVYAGTGAGQAVDDIDIDLVGYDPTASALPANVTQLDGNTIQQSDGYVSLSADTHSSLAAEALATAGGYKNVLEVGSGQAYSTISDAEAAATAGDLIVVHPGTYSEVNIGKNDVTYYLARGAVLDGADAVGQEPLFNGAVSRLRVLGAGTLRPSGQEQENAVIIQSATDADVVVDCDLIDGGTNLTSLIQLTAGTGNVFVRARQVLHSGGVSIVSAGSGGMVSLEADRIATSSGLAQVNNSFARVYIKSRVMRVTTSSDAISGSAGVVVLDGAIDMGHNPTTNGLNAPTGVTVVAQSGSITVPSGRPSLSGSGTFLVSDAFAYNAAAATATNVVATPTRAMYAKLPSKDFLTGTDIPTGDIELDDAEGEAAANVTKWAGQATATGNVAIKNTLAKLTDITGFNDPTAAATATAVRTELTTELARIDDSITSRHPVGAAVASVLGNVEGSVVGSVGSISGVSFPSGFNTLNIADNAVAANVTRFGGTAGTFAGGRPEVNTTLISNDVPVDVVMAGSEAALDNYGALKPTVAGRTLNVSSDGSVTADGVDDLPTVDYFDALFEGAPTFGEAMDAHGYTSALAQRLENLSSMLLLSTTIDGAPSSQASFVLADGPEDDDALNGALVIFTSIADSTKKAVGLVQNYDATTKAVTLFAEPGGFQFGDTDEVDFVATGGSLPLW